MRRRRAGVTAGAALTYAVGHLAGILVLVRRPGRLTVYATGAVAVLNVALNLLLIPALAGEGAAIATLVTEAVLAVTALVMARPVVASPRVRRTVLPPAFAAGAMAAVMAPLQDTLWLALALGGAAYVVVLAAFESRPQGDLASARALLERRLGRATAS